MKNKFCTFIFLIISQISLSQKINRLICDYKTIVIKNNDTTFKNELFIFEKDKITKINKTDSSIISVYDFKKNFRKINNPNLQTENVFSLDDDRITLTNLKDSNNILIISSTIGTTNDTVYFDKNEKIVCYGKGKYSDFIDNGFGFLPIKLLREYISMRDNSTVKVVITLEKKTIL